MGKRLLLVDDHAIVRRGVAALLAGEGEDWEVAGEAGEYEEALEAASRTECVALCRSRGMVPLAIREGGGGRTGVVGLAHRADRNGSQVVRESLHTADGSASRPYQRGWLWGLTLLAILVAGGLWWWPAGEHGAHQDPKKTNEPTNG